MFCHLPNLPLPVTVTPSAPPHQPLLPLHSPPPNRTTTPSINPTMATNQAANTSNKILPVRQMWMDSRARLWTVSILRPRVGSGLSKGCVFGTTICRLFTQLSLPVSSFMAWLCRSAGTFFRFRSTPRICVIPSYVKSQAPICTESMTTSSIRASAS